jgi:hypothetical protein
MVPDSTLAHLDATLHMRWDHPPPAVCDALDRLRTSDAPARVLSQAHRRYALGPDGTLRADAARTERYLDAIEMVDTLAEDGMVLSWALMRRVQAAVLGQPCAFRTGDAFAWDGAVRYGTWPHARHTFATKVHCDALEVLHPVLAACRAYLDVVYFHPFADGNARAARLAMQLMLCANGIAMPDVTQLQRVPKRPGDARRYWTFVHVAARLAQNATSATSQRQRTR